MGEGVNLGSAFGSVEINTEGATSSLNSLSSTMRGLGTGLSLGVTAPLAAVSAAAFKSAGDFEQSMNVMAQVTGATGEQMATLQAQALDLGATTAFSAGEAAEAMLELGKAGLAPAEIGDAIAGTMDLAAAGNLGLAQAATIAANAMNAFQLPASEVTNVANMLAAAANASSVDVTDLAQGMQMAGAVFASNGQSVQDLTTALAILGNNAITGSDAGTSLKTMLLRLASPTDDAAAAMSDLGLEVFNADGSMRGFEDIVGNLQTATAGLTDQQRSMALTTIFGADAIRAATILAREGADGFADMGKAVNKDGAAAATAAARMKGLNGAIEYMKGSIDSFLINAALPFLESKAEMIRRVADLISSIGELPAPMRNAAISIASVAAAIGPVLLVGSKVVSMFGTLGAVMGAILSPVGLLVAAGAALVAVFVTDFMGVRTALANMVDRLLDLAGIDLSGITDGLRSFGNYLVAVVQDGDPLNDWLTHLPEPIQPAVQAIGQLVAAFAGLWQDSDLGAFVQSIQAIDWGGALAAAGDGLNTLKDGIVAALQGIDWGAALETAAGWLDGLKDGVVSAVTGLPWGAALTAAGDFLASLSGGVIAALQSIPWGAALETAGGWLDTLKNGIVAALQSVDWGGALTAAGDWLAGLWGSVVGAVTSIPWLTYLGRAGDFLAGLATGVRNRLVTINWGAILATAGDYLSGLWGNVIAALKNIPWATALTTAAGWLDALKTNVITAIQGIDWAGALTAAGNALGGLETAVAGALGALGFGNLAPSLDGIKGAFDGVSAAVRQAQQPIAAFWAQATALGASVAAFLAPAVGRLQEAFTALPENLAPLLPKLEEMGGAFGRLLGALQPFIAAVGVALVIAAEFGLNRLTTLFQTLPDLLGPVIEQITATINLIATIINETVAAVRAVIDGDWAAVWESAKTIAGEFNSFFRGLFSRLGTFMGAVARNISEPIIQTLKTLGVDIVPHLESVRKFFEDIWAKVLTYIQPVIDLVEGVQTAIEEFQEWLSTVSLPNPFAPLVDAWNAVKGGIASLTGGDGTAGGTSYFGGGPTAINERGYEQVVLPAGSRVYTNGQTNNLPDDGPTVININLGGVTVSGDMDARRLGNVLRDQLALLGV